MCLYTIRARETHQCVHRKNKYTLVYNTYTHIICVVYLDNTKPHIRRFGFANQQSQSIINEMQIYALSISVTREYISLFLFCWVCMCIVCIK